MRSIVAALIALLVVVPCAQADEADLRRLVEVARGATPLRDAWERCTASIVRQELKSRRTAQQLADHALGRCEAQEKRLRAALARARGAAEGRRVTALLRRIHRSNLIAVIDLLRQER
jgi:hypothetical protein